MPQTGAAMGDAQRRRTTIVDLADHLGLTKGTVSRALNGYPDISEQTRTRVRKAAEHLDYRPLTHAQAIRTGRVRAIGLVLDVSEHDGHRPFLADFLAGVSAGAAQEDWTLTVTTAETGSDTARLLAKLHDERKVDGFILPRTYEQDDRVTALRQSGVPHVLFGRVQDTTDTAYFDIAGEQAMAEAVARLHALGHRKIGFVQGGTGYTYTRLRREGYVAGLASVGLPFRADLVAGPAVSQEMGAAATRALLSRPKPPTAIVFSVDQAALGAYRAARAFGLEIGRDLSVMSYDGIPEGALMSPRLSTFRVDLRQAGMRLSQMLIRTIRGEPPGDMQELVLAEFTAGQSHAAPRLSSAALEHRIKTSMSTGGMTDEHT